MCPRCRGAIQPNVGSDYPRCLVCGWEDYNDDEHIEFPSLMQMYIARSRPSEASAGSPISWASAQARTRAYSAIWRQGAEYL